MTRCINCKAHPAVMGGRLCSECLNAYLRATRPNSGLPEWRRRSLEDQRQRGMVAVKAL